MNNFCNRSFQWKNSGSRCDVTFTLCGSVTIAGEGTAAGIPVNYTVDGITFTKNTDASGNYCLVVPAGSNVTVELAPMAGFMATPPQFKFTRLCCCFMNLDFTLTPVAPSTRTVSGALTGLASTSGLMVAFTINGEPRSVPVNGAGTFAFEVPYGADVTITPPNIEGYAVSPQSYTFASVTNDMPGNNFAYAMLVGSPATASAMRNQRASVSSNLSAPSAFSIPTVPSAPRMALVSGKVSGLDGRDNMGLEVSHVIDGVRRSTRTGATGAYSFPAPIGSNVMISPATRPGYSVSPTAYSVNCISGTLPNQNFAYTKV